MRKLARKNKQFYRRSVLPNGIVVLSEPTKHFRSLAIGVWVNRGSRHETPKQMGMAHFLEHMMFKGTSKRTAFEIARDVDLVGGDFNAMTTREYTCFHLTLPASEIDFSLDLLTDILKDSKFDPVELERERGVILQEIPMTEESPEEYVYDILFEKAFGRHPLGLPILGTEAHVKSFKRKDVVEYFQRHYNAKNIVISVAGAVNHQKLVRKLTKLLGDFKGKPQKMPAASLRKPKFKPGLHVIKKDMDQVHLALACEAYEIMHPKRITQFLMNAYLGGSMSSALFQSIRERRGLAYSVYSSLAPFTDFGLLGIYAATASKSVKTCLELMHDEVKKLQLEPLSENDLLVAKNTIKSAIMMGADSMENRMFALGKSELFFNGQKADWELCEDIDRVTTQDIWDVAREIFGKNRWCLVALGPVKKADLLHAFRTK